MKRCLFEAYLRPRRTTIKLISTSASSSAAFPGGEAFHFSFSPNGHFVLALCSSRLYVLSLTEALVAVRREFKISRRPVSATISDDASILAVLSTDHQVNIYDLTDSKAKHVRSVPLDNPPRTIALSPGASVLAAAYEGGIEVYSLAKSALPSDRRAVKCDAVDSLAFSSDGTMLLGTTQHSPTPNTVIISAPYYTGDGSGASTEDILSQMWTTQILFPSSSRDCSHATLLPHRTEGQANWTFAHDRALETFRAVRVDDLRNGTTYFTGPKSKSRNTRLLPCTLPAATEKGESVAAGFSGTELWLYGVPEALNTDHDRRKPQDPGIEVVVHSSDTEGPAVRRGAGSQLTPLWNSAERSDGAALPHWQLLLDRDHNTFVKGRQIAILEGISSTRWVAQKGLSGSRCWDGERLVAVAPGGVSSGPDNGSDEPVPVDGGRILILDFDRGATQAEPRTITLELGESTPEILEEESRDLETEVAIFRRRTIAMAKGGLAGSPMIRTTRPGPAHTDPISVHNRRAVSSAHLEAQQPRSPGPILVPDSAPATSASPVEDDLTVEEAQEALDGPYSHSSPRSRTTLYRAATAAAVSQRQYTPRVPQSGRVEYRRADGRRELPHESDADNWVPPPPPYTRDPELPLPQHLQMTLLPRQTEHTGRFIDTVRPHRTADSTQEGTLQDGSLRTFATGGTVDDVMRAGCPELESGITDPALRLAELNQQPEQSAQTRRPVSYSLMSRTESVAAAVYPSSSSPTATRRRPLSAYADLAARSPSSQRAITASPTLPIPERPAFGNWRSLSTPASPIQVGPPSTSFTTIARSSPTPDLAYSTPPVSNVQHRSSNPIPPLSSIERSEASSPFTVPSQTVSVPIASSQPSARHSDAPMHPSAGQLANLQNRYSRAQSRIVPRPASASYHRNYGHAAPAPPRGALGATSRSSSPSGNPTVAPARALSRSNSRGSTPSVSARNQIPQRPTYRRLDTIQSIASFVSHHSHTRSRSKEIATSLIPARVPSRAERSAAINVQAAKKNGRAGGKRIKKAKEPTIQRSDSQEWTDIAEQPPAVRKKSSKCTIM